MGMLTGRIAVELGGNLSDCCVNTLFKERMTTTGVPISCEKCGTKHFLVRGESQEVVNQASAMVVKDAGDNNGKFELLGFLFQKSAFNGRNLDFEMVAKRWCPNAVQTVETDDYWKTIVKEGSASNLRVSRMANGVLALFGILKA